MNVESVRALLDSVPKPPHIVYAYGTAGFRMKNDANQLDSALVRAALLACVRSLSHNGQAVGIMVRIFIYNSRDNTMQ
jgi:phosphoacetylglucosamine mutase